MTTRPRNFPQTAGVHSRPRVEFPRATAGHEGRNGSVVSFAASTTWVAPPGARLLTRLYGKGADGKPATGASDIRRGYLVYTTSVLYSFQQGRYIYGTEAYSNAIITNSIAQDYREFDSEDANFQYYTDYRFVEGMFETGNYVPASSGAASTAFGQVFAGGPAGEPAPITTFRNVQITAGGSYPIAVPLGGNITIEY